MTSPSAAAPAAPSSDPLHFSLVLGGPLFQLLRRARLADDGLELLRKRMLVFTLVCWLPLLLLCGLQGELLDGAAAIPFLRDVEVHSRFLLALPLLIAAELIAHQRMRPVIGQFVERGLVPDAARERFEAAIASAVRLRNSVWAELALAVCVLVGGRIGARYFMLSDAVTWYAHPSAEGLQYSQAGAWYAYVSLPIFQFIIARWYFRLFIWWRLLWQVSRVALQLVVTHPDGVAGLSFLSAVVAAFAPIASAHGALFAGRLANRIFYAGALLPQFKMDAFLLVVFLLLIVLGPLLVFSPQLARAKRAGRLAYDVLAQRYVREFEAKWLRGNAPADESLLGSGDIQSLADLGNSLGVVRGMRTAPVTRDSIVTLTLATLLPAMPLLLTMMPLEDLLKKLLGALF